jgi:hypothetical protein
LIPKPLRGSKSPLFWRFIEFLRPKKIRPENIAIKGHKNCIFFEKMYLNLFRQDIKKIFLLMAFQQSLNSGQKTADFRRYRQIFVKNRCRFTPGDLKAFFQFFCFDCLHIYLATIFVSASFLPKVSKVKERG